MAHKGKNSLRWEQIFAPIGTLKKTSSLKQGGTELIYLVRSIVK